jgi:hypothetical protein
MDLTAGPRIVERKIHIPGYWKLGRYDRAQVVGVYTRVLETRQIQMGPNVWGIYLGI